MGNNRRVVLVNPRATYFRGVESRCLPPMQLLYLAAALRKAGVTAVIVDANARGLSDASIAREIGKVNPFLVGIPVYSGILAHVRSLARLVRATVPEAYIVLGGPHATAMPMETLDHIRVADYVLTGEADETLPRLAEKLEDGLETGDIPGVWAWRDGRCRGGLPAPLPQVSSLQQPARNLVSASYECGEYYDVLMGKRPFDVIFTSRGCPYGCRFCAASGRLYRSRTPGDVMNELVLIRDRGIRAVDICDETFTFEESRAIVLFDLIIKEKLGLSLRIWSRSDAFTERLASRAAKAGVSSVAFGMESGSQRILDAMNKGVNVAHNAQACRVARKHGIRSHASWIVGYPGETRETIEETRRFILSNKPDTVSVSVLVPFPNTPAYVSAKDNGTLVGDWHPDAPEPPWVRLPWIRKRADLKNVRKDLLKNIYINPHYVASLSKFAVRHMNWRLIRYALQELSVVRLAVAR